MPLSRKTLGLYDGKTSGAPGETAPGPSDFDLAKNVFLGNDFGTVVPGYVIDGVTSRYPAS